MSLIVIFYILAVISGIRSAYPSQESILDHLVSHTGAFVLCIWAIGDSIARGQPIPLLSRSWVLWTALLSVPIYVIWSRGWRGVGLIVTHVLAWYVVCYAVMSTTFKQLNG